MAQFEGKVVAVTGGISGIGKETAAGFITVGARVVINGRDAAKLEVVAREIDPTGEKVIISAGDIAFPSTGAALVDEAVSKFGGLDALVNNAGVFNPKSFLELTEAGHGWYLDAILKGKFFAAPAAAQSPHPRLPVTMPKTVKPRYRLVGARPEIKIMLHCTSGASARH